MTEQFRIDTHHHIVPPLLWKEAKDRVLAMGMGRNDGILAWTPERALEQMDQGRIQTAVTSISTPGVWFGDVAQYRRIARDANEFAARMRADHKGRFGVFAAIALPDVEGTLKEIEYCLDVLKVDGFGLVTNYDTTWPGDPKFAPIWDELNRRKAVVYFHPTAAPCCMSLVPQVTPAMVEFAFDTTRAIISLLFSGTLARCPDIRFLFSHGGGTLPMLAGRIAASARNRTDLEQVAPKGVMHEIRRLYYDTVSVFDSNAFTALQAMADPAHLTFGSDYPYWTTSVNIDALAAHPIAADVRRAIERDNALALLPTLSPAGVPASSRRP
jgi:predicted TIM-barrel fold metal-dependent hydrolase